MEADVSVGLACTPTDASVVTRHLTALPNARSKTVSLRSRAPTPIKLGHMIPFLKSYDKEEAQFLCDGFEKGFHLGYMGPRVTVKSRNLQSAKDREDVLVDKIMQEVDMGRIAGPFESPSFENFRCSPVGLVPKKTPGEFRLIQHLSAPRNNSVKGQIDPQDCSVTYATFDDAISLVQGAGRGSCMGKADVKSAFRLLPVHPDDFDLLGMCVDGKFYYDRCMPMGCSVSCAVFERFSSFLEYCCRRVAVSSDTLHHLDDFFFVGKAEAECMHLLCSFKGVCERFGVPIAAEKTEGPDTKITFLGLEIDSVEGQIRVPQDKLSSLQALIRSVLPKEKVTLRKLQSIIGSLNFVCRAVAPGRAFLRRLIDMTIGVKQHHHKIRITRGARADLLAWLHFLSEFNGRVLFVEPHIWNTPDLQFYTDASGSIGFGVYFSGKWTQGRWPAGVGTPKYSIALLEFFPIVVGLQLWGADLANKRCCCGRITRLSLPS
ncbi:uncharacterized protein [Diadema setosum]|uniref:uncharacterized protein n=1 Tax=Diadema setosum TaxID=31175 RepID=UPI003B3ACFCD